MERARALRVFFQPGPEIERGVEGVLPESGAVSRRVREGSLFQERGEFGGGVEAEIEAGSSLASGVDVDGRGGNHERTDRVVTLSRKEGLARRASAILPAP